MNKTKLYKFINTALSILITLIALYYLISSLKEKAGTLHLNSITEHLKSNWQIILLVFALMPLNWFCEIIKWRRVVSKLESVSYLNAFKSITLGVTVALLTPNGIGEIGGRLIYIKKEQRLMAMYYGAFLSVSQLLITITFGILGLYFVQESILMGLNLEPSLLFSFLLLAIPVVLIIIYFFSSLMSRIILFLKKSIERGRLIISKKERAFILTFSSFRYLIFSTQFVLLIVSFDPSVELFNAYGGVALVYLATAIIPTAWISDLIVRTSVAFFVFSTLGYSGEAAVISSALLWVVNLFIPATIGLFRIKDINWTKFKTLLPGT